MACGMVNISASCLMMWPLLVSSIGGLQNQEDLYCFNANIFWKTMLLWVEITLTVFFFPVGHVKLASKDSLDNKEHRGDSWTWTGRDGAWTFCIINIFMY